MSKSTEDRRYLLHPDNPSGPYYQVVQRDSGWQWLWIEAGEAEDAGPVVETRADALWAAAQDAEDTIDDDSGSGRRLANRLRLAARAVRS
ncbi:MAG: hypothetical protein IE923_04410 [Micrococcales bacterium]|nr:hypothetical protein [Micrococcales bacterium]